MKSCNALRLASALTLAFLFIPLTAPAAPQVTVVSAAQRTDGSKKVDIVYDLAGGNGPMLVTVLVSPDNGGNWNVAPSPSFLSGDVGSGIVNGAGLQIVWDAAADRPEVYWPQCRVRVTATEATPEPTPTPYMIGLEITSTLPEGSVSQVAEQTFTFTFSEPVTGFEAADVAVTGGAKGAFEEISAAQYTLGVTGAGGTVSVSVPEDAARSVAHGGAGYNSAAGPYSNFHQDTWTLELQESPLVTMDLIRIPAGTFTMGSPVGELSRNNTAGVETQHTVTLTQDFYLGKTEVTQNQWVALQSFPQAQSFVGGTMPVHNVSHNDIGSWMTELNTHVTEPGTFSLPTEAQWEYACRAGTTTRFNFGDGLSTDELCATGGGREDNMWYCGSGTEAVGQKPANAWGLWDMHGNMWEWCSDWYDTYPGTVTDPTGPGSGSERVIRGGSWVDYARDCRSAQRGCLTPSDRWSIVGFRVLAVR